MWWIKTSFTRSFKGQFFFFLQNDKDYWFIKKILILYHNKIKTFWSLPCYIRSFSWRAPPGHLKREGCSESWDRMQSARARWRRGRWTKPEIAIWGAKSSEFCPCPASREGRGQAPTTVSLPAGCRSRRWRRRSRERPSSGLWRWPSERHPVWKRPFSETSKFELNYIFFEREKYIFSFT